jgi:uncharacterized protein
LHLPERPGARIAVLVAHGMHSSKQSDKHRRICDEAARLGHLALRFDFAGCGESEGRPEDVGFTGEIDDLRSAMAAARGLGAERLALVGSSMGGTVSILVAAQEPTIAALATIAAPAYLHDRAGSGWPSEILERAWAEGRFEVRPGVFMSRAFLEDARRYHVLGEAPKVQAPWLIVHGQQDESVPWGDAEALAQAQPRARLVLNAQADHRFSCAEDLDWLVGQVGASPSTW